MSCFSKLYKTLIYAAKNEHFLEIIRSGIYTQLFNYMVRDLYATVQLYGQGFICNCSIIWSGIYTQLFNYMVRDLYATVQLYGQGFIRNCSNTS